MLVIDKTIDRTPQQQIVDYFRFEIALGHAYKVGDTLPSTRSMAKELGVSFHTVRKAYHLLELEGLVEATKGSGFSVVQRSALDNPEKLERGAAIVSDAIRRLIGLGLDVSDIEYVVDEQLGLFTTGYNTQKIVVVGPYEEFGVSISRRVSEIAMVTVESCTEQSLSLHSDADVVVVPIEMMKSVVYSIPNSEVVSIDTNLPVDAMEAVAKLLDYESLGLLTGKPDAIGPLTRRIKEKTGFSGQIIASSATTTRGKLVDTFVSQVDLLLHTPEAGKIVARHVDRRDVTTYQIVEELTTESLEKVRSAIG